MVIVPFSDLKSDTLDVLVNQRNADGVLILLPKYTRRTKETQLEAFRQLEADLVNRKFNVPVYFAWEDASLQVTLISYS
jgi:RNase H-fold protein (predicted Holliday junction resolvase)